MTLVWDGTQPLLSFEMPCSVHEFFNVFWADDSDFFRLFLECDEQGCTVRISPLVCV